MAKVLVVDDNATNRELVVTVLQSQGHRILEAADGAEGLAMVRIEHPQLVISDVLMPTMDGYEFVRQLRSDPALAQTEVIFYTAHYREREARELALACGVSSVLVKPCDPEQMLSAVGRALAHQPLPALQVAQHFDREHLRLLMDKLSHKADKLQAANLRLAALAELSVQLAAELHPRPLLDRACRGACDLIGASYAVLAVCEQTHGARAFLAVSGIEPALVATLEPPAMHSVEFAQMLAQRRPRRFANLRGDPAAAGLPRGYPPADSALAAPIASVTFVYGWICLVNKLGAEEFSEEDERALAIVAAQTGRIFENDSLYVDLQQHAAQLKTESSERQHATEKLRDSEQRFRQLAENIHEVFFLTDPANTQILYISPAYEQIWGRSCVSLYADPASWADTIHPDDRAAVAAENEQRSATGRLDYQYRIVRPDGTIRWIWARGFPIRNEAGQIYRVAGLAEDITERKLAQDKIRRLNRTHAVLSGVNSLIVRVRSREELFRESCRIVVEQGDFRFAWIGVIDPATQDITCVASAGEDQGFGQLVRFSLDGTMPKAGGLIGTAITSRQTTVCNDVEANQETLVYGSEMIQRGFRAAAALPLVADGKAIGCLALYTSEPDFFDDEEIRLLVQLAGDISFALEHIEKAERLNYLALYDPVTDLGNHTLFKERLSQVVSASSPDQRRVAVVFADIERFKIVNDTHGRHLGDQVLKQLAKRLIACVGNANRVARIGADQFAAIMVDAEHEGGVVRTINRWWWDCFGWSFPIGKDEVRISAKAGIALFPNDGEDAETLLTNAEAALNRAKASGDRHLFYTQQMTERVAQKLALETRLRRALENDEFVLHYQPQVDLETRRIVGVEALIRWQSPELGLVPPGEFIPLMEETGIILDAGTWVLRRAIQDRSDWLERNLDAPRIAINVSAVQLREPEFVATVASLLETRTADCGIDFEVTESQMMQNVEEHIVKLDALRKMGVGIAIDDFGTGYSSLAYLARLPVESLKIDRGFVHAMLDDPGAMTLVQTMISLAHSLKLKVVAEGVETEEQAKILRLLRCDRMQGFYFSKPMPAQELVALFSKRRT
jgi:diguanylate cyclase (GGDEF)-like protein/PAS domain S-box-containing protein